MYEIVFDGFQKNLKPQEALMNLSKLFNCSTERLEQLVTNSGFVLKKGLSEDQAARYKTAIEAAGGSCQVRSEVVACDMFQVDLKRTKKIHQESMEATDAQQIAEEKKRNLQTVAIMPNEYTNRRDNLRKLIEQWGGPSSLSSKLGYSNASFLVQMAGPNPIREISERTARKIERALDLPSGFLDGKAPESVPKVSTELLTVVVRFVGQVCQDAGIKVTPAKFADIVSVVYADADKSGGLREDFARSIVQLAK